MPEAGARLHDELKPNVLTGAASRAGRILPLSRLSLKARVGETTRTRITWLGGTSSG